MSALFIDKDDVVLELGGNIGRNSLVIASLLEKSENLVVVESDPAFVELLGINRNLNNFDFSF